MSAHLGTEHTELPEEAKEYMTYLSRIDAATTAVLSRVFDDCVPRPDGSTKGLHWDISQILISHLPNTSISEISKEGR
jgi:hypothetical protein